MSETLHSFALRLLTDPQAMAAYELDPMAMLSKAGLDDITPQDVQEIIPLVMDSAAVGTFSAAAGGTLGDFAAAGDLSSDGPAGAFGLFSPQGEFAVAGSPTGLSAQGTDSFSSISDLGGSLDADALAGATGAVAGVTGAAAGGFADGAGFMGRTTTDGADTTGGMLGSGTAAIASDLTSGANTAASLMSAGASSMASLMGTGAGFTGGALVDPMGTAADGVSTVTQPAHTQASASESAAVQPLPVDAPQLPVDLPQLPGVPGVPGVPGLPGLPELPALPGLPLPELPALPELPVPLPEVPGLPELPVGTPDGGASGSPLGNVLGGLTQPSGATDLLGGVTDLDGGLPL
jgi:hypothetical protein